MLIFKLLASKYFNTTVTIAISLNLAVLTNLTVVRAGAEVLLLGVVLQLTVPSLWLLGDGAVKDLPLGRCVFVDHVRLVRHRRPGDGRPAMSATLMVTGETHKRTDTMLVTKEEFFF